MATYLVRLNPTQNSAQPRPLTATIPTRMLRTQDKEGIKRYLAQTLNLQSEHIAAFEPFYR